MSLRLEEELAVEAMNLHWKTKNDPRFAVHIGYGPGRDVEVRLQSNLIGLGEIAADEDPGIKERNRLLSERGWSIKLPAGFGDWSVQVNRPRVAGLQAGLPQLVERLKEEGRSELDLARSWPETDTERLAHKLGVEVIFRVARTDGGLPPDRAIVMAASGGVRLSSDPDEVVEYVELSLGRHPYARKVERLQSVATGEAHLIAIVGTRTMAEAFGIHWNSLQGYPALPTRSLALPAGISDFWLVNIFTGWSLWWSQLGWSQSSGQVDWWRQQAHLS